MFIEGQKVVKIIHVRDYRSATVQIVDLVHAGRVELVGSSITYRNEDGLEIDPFLPGCYSEIIPFDEG
jgi:hypothetical protein